MILTEEGYTTLSGTTSTYYYYLKDHQGNNRVVINQGGAIQQVNHYYPFGGLFGEGIQVSNQPYKYSGKELDRQFGLDISDHGARHYDAATGRWFTVDPLAEKYYSISSYVYVANNPTNLIDPTGMSYDWVQDRDKYVYWDGNAISPTTTKEGETYIGKTVYATDEEENFKYGDQYGNWHDSAPLGEVSVTGFQTSGKGPISAGIRNAARGYDPEWIEGFHQFVDAGLAAINITLSATMLAANTGSLGGATRARAALNTTGNSARGGTTVLGHYPEYVKVAETIGARTFQIPTKVWNKMSAVEQWGANQKFLDRMILRGDNIRLATPLNQVKPGSFFQKELNYLFDKGYKVSSDGLWLVK